MGLLVVLGVLLIPRPWATFSGFLYCLIGPLIFIGGAVLVPEPKKSPKPGT
jgi:hypothetical protein